MKSPWMNNLVAFNDILKTLTPENREKVIDKLHQYNDGGLEESIFDTEEEIKQSENNINEAISTLKETSDHQKITGLIKEIKDQAILASPQNASDDLKQNAIAQTFTAVLKELTPIQDHKEAVQALSFALGQEILQPLSNEKDIASASKKIGEWADKGKVKTPGNCGKDLFRFTPRMNIIGKDDSTPINRSVFEGLEGTDKSEKTGTQMIGILNQVYREISGLDEDLITKGDFEKIDSQDNAAAFAEKFSSILDKKGIEQDHKEVLMQFLSLIGMQEIPTRVGDWAIPGGQNPSDEKAAPLNDYRKGVQNLQVAEFSPAYVNATQPLQYARTMDFKILENGKFELQIYSPITFQDKSEMTKQAVGTCGVVSTLVFNSKLEFETMSQKVVPAEIKP